MSELTRTHAEKVNSTKDILERKLQEIADLELQHANDKAIIEALNERVREIERQLDEYEAGSVLRWQCYQRAVNRWQESTGVEHVWPDGTDLVLWLMEQLDKLKRPPMTRELPQVAGDFHYCADGREGEVVNVFFSRGILRGKGNKWKYSLRVADISPGYWSARPIEMDPMPEGGE